MKKEKQSSSKSAEMLKSVFLHVKCNKNDIITALCLAVFLFVTAYFFLGFEKNGINSLYFYAGGDDTATLAEIKQIDETGWISSNSRVAAPFELKNSFDFSSKLLQNTDRLIIKIIGIFTDDIVVINNVFMLLIFPLCGINAYIVFRALNQKRTVSIFGSVMFAFSPYIFWRLGGHTCLSASYFVPFSVLLCVWAFQREDKNYLAFNKSFFKNRRNIAVIVMCLLIANNGIGYYPYFTCFFLCIVMLCRLLREKKITSIAAPVKTIGFIALFFVIALIPHIIYIAGGGVNSAVRSISDAEIYSLRISQLFVPLNGHGISILNDFINNYNSVALNINENRGAYLGVAGIVGFVLSIITILSRPKTEYKHDDKLFILSRMNICAVLLASTGGLCSVIGMYFTMIRGYNRISIFISFISILVLCTFIQRVYDKLADGSAPSNGTGLTVCLCLFGALCLYDLLPTYGSRDSAMEDYTRWYNSDRLFVQEIENQLGDGASVFQLPYHAYPESGPQNNMMDYHHYIGYIHSNTLKWSYGSAKGSTADSWSKTISMLPTEDFVNIICKAGFNGIYIDVRAYTDEELQVLTSDIEAVIDISPIKSEDGNLMFYDLSDYIERNNITYDESVIYDESVWGKLKVEFKPSSLYNNGDSYRDAGMIVLRPSSLQYGPYYTFDAGDYVVEISGSNLLFAEYDAAYDSGKEKIAINELQHSNDKIVYSFSANSRIEGVEFRTFNNSDDEIVVKRIIVEENTAE